jgi:hypothetical protein
MEDMEFMKAMLAEIIAKMDATREKMNTDTIAIQAKTKLIQEKLDAHQQMTETGLKQWETENKTGLEETEATNLEVNPGKMECGREQREVSKKEAAVKPSGNRKKRHRGRNLAAGRCGKPNELIRGF